MFRKRRQPAPHFKLAGAPFNPATGEHAQLGTIPGKGTTLAMFQVVEEDTHDNYVVCRGYEADNDPRFEFLHDPYSFPDTTPINVAKPYGARGTFPYVEGQIIVAARIKGKLGYNPGKAETTVGHPADLDEATVLLKDDADVAISWMDVATPPAVEQSLFFYELQTVGIGAVEQSIEAGLNSGILANITTGGLQPVTNFVKLATASARTVLYWHLTGYAAKEVALGNPTKLFIYIKQFNSLDVLLGTTETWVDIPTLGGTGSAGGLARMGRSILAAGDYLLATTKYVGGTYAGTIGLSDFCFYCRPIRGV